MHQRLAEGPSLQDSKTTAQNVSFELCWRFLVALITLVIVAVPATGQAQPGPSPSPPTEGSIVEAFLILDGAIAEKLVSLGKAIPAERFDWRPTEGVRSVGEVFLHLAETNFEGLKNAGIPLPPTIPEDLSTVKDKKLIIALTEQSFTLLHEVAKGMGGLDPNQPLPGVGGPSLSFLVLANTEHHAEHLGQLVAYARGLGVVPPWSR